MSEENTTKKPESKTPSNAELIKRQDDYANFGNKSLETVVGELAKVVADLRAYADDSRKPKGGRGSGSSSD